MTGPPIPITRPKWGRCSWVSALLATLTLVAGCGGSTSDPAAKFKASYRSTRTQLKQTSQAIGDAIQQAPSQTDGQVRATFRGLAERWQTHLSQLQTLKVPAGMSTEFNTLTGAATRVESDLNAAVTAAATHSGSAAQQAGASIVNDITAARQADAVIAHKLHVN